ncbi:MAG: ABC transporter substrate-binding protein [Actinomycetota bacterium]
MSVRYAKRFRLLALAAVCALVLAACGDGRDDGEADRGGDDETEETTGDDTDTTDGDEPAAFEIDTADCATDPTSVTVEGDTIKLGTSLPQSGIYAAFAEILRGEQAYIQYLNEELGGVDIGGTRYQIELVSKDDGYASDQTVSNVDSLIADDDVFALFNVVGTKNNLAIRDIVNEECIPSLFAATGSPAWGNHDYPWIIGTLLVPYPLEMKAFVDYLGENMPEATIALLRADDDFGRSYSETLAGLVEGTDITVVAEEVYDPEGADVATQVTTLAATDADVFVLGATLLGCPASLNEIGTAGWDPIVYMSGTCTSKTLMAAAGANGDGVFSVGPLMDPNDPQFAANPAMVLYKEKVAQYQPDADPTNGIVAYGWSAAALLHASLEATPELNRLAVMQTARTLSDLSDIGLQLPDASWSVGPEDWFLGEEFNLVQYSVADGYFAPQGEMVVADDLTEEITPDQLING